MVGEPPLLLADEPTGNLDTESGAGIMAAAAGSARSGTTVLVITHDREIAGALPRQITIRDGRLSDDDGGSR